MAIKEIFLNLTSTTMPMGHERLAERWMPSGWKKDAHGNYFYKIGESTTMFTCHLDTADSGQPKPVTHDIKGNIIKTDGKTILGADDKAGAAVLIYMIEHKIPGLYYFFLGEERGRVGSQALSRTIKADKENPLYKNINKCIAFDRSDTYSIITYQSSERCCSDAFAEDLAEKLNATGKGLNYRKDPTGLFTDSYSFIEIYPECTNLSVGYKNQHQVGELQDIEFLQRLADAALIVDWESLKIVRDHTKTEYKSYYGGNYSNYGGGRRDYAYTNEWDQDNDWWQGSRQETTSGPTKTQSATGDYIKDYLGDSVKKSDCVWCEYDKVWCLKDDAIWVEYIGFYTTPDIDPNRPKSKTTKVNPEDLRPLVKEDIKVGLDIYENDKLYGNISEIDDEYGVHVSYYNKNTVLILPMDKFIKQGYYVKNLESSNGLPTSETAKKTVTPENIKENMLIWHPSFGAGKVISIRSDKLIAKVNFKNGKETKDLRIDVANMKY